MKFSEILDRCQVCDDEKARRVLNVSRAAAKITAEEIENGVTIERLETIGVPVFKYKTQVTIHGAVPDFNPEARPLGYKAIFKNGNGSLGVKYIAIDGEKKKTIVRAARMAEKREFSASIKSTGLELIASTLDREKALAMYRAFPRELIIGGLFAARGMFGEFFIVADVGAVPAANLWPLIKALYGFEDENALAAAEKAQDAAWTARRAEAEQKAAERDAAAAEALAGKLATLADRPKGKPLFPGEFIICRDVLGKGPQIVRYKTERGSFGRWFYRCTLDGQPFNTEKKPAVVADTLRARWETYAAAGQVFAA